MFRVTIVLAFIVSLIFAPFAQATSPSHPAQVPVATAADVSASKCTPTKTHTSVKPFKASSRLLTNRPLMAGGNDAQQHVTTQYVEHLIDATPPDASIDTGMFSLTYDPVKEALLEADDRGSHVHYMTWKKYEKSKGEDELPDVTDQVKRLTCEFGLMTKDPKDRSYVRICKGSCFTTSVKGATHSKLIAISHITGKNGKPIRWIILSSSGNMTYAAGRDSWNEAVVIVGNKKLYDASVKYIAEMKYDHTDYTHPDTCSGKYCLYFSPSKKIDPALADLKKVKKCTGVKKGYGRNGRTLIRVAMSIWTSKDSDTAKELVRLKKLGCDIEVIGSISSWTRSITNTLLKGNIRVWDAGFGDKFYLHSKAFVIDGIVDGKYVHRVHTGSKNRTYAGQRQNAEQMLRIDDAKYAGAYVTRFEFIVSHFGERVVTV